MEKARGKGGRKKKRGKIEDIERTPEREVWRVAFWNVTKLGNKDREFWEKIKEWDVIIMMETWIDKKRWKKLRGKLPKDYIWKIARSWKIADSK